MARFTSQLLEQFRTRDDLVRLIKSVLDVGRDRRADGGEGDRRIGAIRQLLGDSNAFNPAVLRNYKRRDLPESLLQGVALALVGLQRRDAESVSPRVLPGDRKMALDGLHDVYADLLGLEFGRVINKCRLMRSSRGNSNYLDAEIVTTYQRPKVHSNFGRVKFVIANIFDAYGEDAKFVRDRQSGGRERILRDGESWYGIRVHDVGSDAQVAFDDSIEVDGVSLGRTELTQIRRHDATGPVDASDDGRRLELKHTVNIDKDVGENTAITVVRRVLDAFRTSRPGGEVPVRERLQVASYKVERPTRELQLQLQFPSSLEIEDPEDIPVDVHSWGPWSVDIQDFNYAWISRQVIRNAVEPIANRSWRWSSHDGSGQGAPVIMGLIYGLTYNCYHVNPLSE